MDIESFRDHIDHARRRYEKLHRGEEKAPYVEILLELGNTLEELQVASEELEGQSERVAGLQETALSITRRYANLFEHAPVAYLVTTLDGMIVEANTATAELVGRDPASLVRKPIVSLATASERLSLRASVVRAGRGEDGVAGSPSTVWLQHGTRGPFEAVAWASRLRSSAGPQDELCWIVIPRPPGTERGRTSDGPCEALVAAAGGLRKDVRVGDTQGLGSVLEVAADARRREDALAGPVWTLGDGTDHGTIERELTEARRESAVLRGAIERAEAAVLGKIEIVRTLAHEVRNPMTTMLGAASMLGETLSSEEEREYLAMIEHAGEDAISILEGAIELSRTQSGAARLVDAEIDLFQTLVDVVRSSCVDPSSGGPEVSCILDPGLPRRVLGDPERLRQILRNLVGNALKFTDAGEVTVRAGRDPEARFLCISVADTGPGIEPERLGSIFEPFAAGGEARRIHGGSGLGLSISKELVERMGGSIRVESTLGYGTRFEARLPLRPAATQPPPVVPFARRPEILVADARPTSRQALADRLASWGAEVSQATDPGAVRAEIDRAGDKLSALVLDVRIAGRDDFALLESLRSRPGLLARTLIVLPVRHRGGDVARLRELAVGGWILRPFRDDELYASLARTLGADPG